MRYIHLNFIFVFFHGSLRFYIQLPSNIQLILYVWSFVKAEGTSKNLNLVENENVVAKNLPLRIRNKPINRVPQIEFL
jgi:hypothetical protein